MKPSKKMLYIVLAVIAAFVLIAGFGIGDGIKGVQKMRFGIDIRGGVEAIFAPENLDRKATETELELARTIIEKRLDNINITDREVTIDKEGGYIIVRFPWKSDETNFNPEDAISELGDMAKLTFRDPDGNILLEGKNIKSSSPEQDNSGVNTNYMVSLTFDDEGAKLFEEATGNLIGKKMGIYMDEEMIQDPVVKSKISGGQAVIDNMDSFDEAVALSEKINAGSLPFSLSSKSFSTISPSLGADALKVMVYAGIIAFFLVCLFMISKYKLPGLVACLTLTLQTAIQLLAISVPQYTLTLPGIAGIILSIGMAVDTNIIISERIMDKIKEGFSVRESIKEGYKSAFSAVLDGNVTTAIVAIILMIFGSGSMLSFGYTLLMGMIVNVFVGVSVSKSIILSAIEFKKWNDEKWFGKKKDQKIYAFYKNKVFFALFSGVLFAIGISACVMNGVKLDTQFTGGAVLSYVVADDVDTEAIKGAIAEVSERPATVQVAKGTVRNDSRLVVTLAGTNGMSPEEQKEITAAINGVSDSIKAELAETYVAEPYIGAKALKNSIIAIVLSAIFIIVYVWIRFAAIGGLSAGLTAMASLLHDVMIVFFTFAVFRIPLNDAFVAVVLTIIGYSINDTIVIYDRIRENRNTNGKTDVVTLVNTSISQTMVRSINTSITTGTCMLVILVASVFFQIDSIREFSIPMFLGLLSGCYSTICIASILWAMWEKKKETVKSKA